MTTRLIANGCREAFGSNLREANESAWELFFIYIDYFIFDSL